METVSFKPSEEFKNAADRLFVEQKDRISAVLPSADIQHIGGTAVLGLLTKGDLDINVRVQEVDFDTAVKALGRLYEINQPANWTKAFASFKDDTSYSLPLGIQLTVIDSSDDHFIGHREALWSSQDLVTKFNEIKQKNEGGDMETYRAEKAAFLKSL